MYPRPEVSVFFSFPQSGWEPLEMTTPAGKHLCGSHITVREDNSMTFVPESSKLILGRAYKDNARVLQPRFLGSHIVTYVRQVGDIMWVDVGGGRARTPISRLYDVSEEQPRNSRRWRCLWPHVVAFCQKWGASKIPVKPF